MSFLLPIVLLAILFAVSQTSSASAQTGPAATQLTPSSAGPSLLVGLAIGDDRQLTPNFRWSEFYRPLDRVPDPDAYANYQVVAENLEIVRTAIGDRPINITPHGGWHPLNLGASEGWPVRTTNSRHRSPSVRAADKERGQAVDFYSPGLSVAELLQKVTELINQGKMAPGYLTAYHVAQTPGVGFVHWDNRG